jgi:iron complex outermembrane receptor protein
MRTSDRNELSAHILYTDLMYQTPGGLTLAQYNANPRDARPGTLTIPGAVANNATIYQKAFLAGITNRTKLSGKWQNSTTLFTSYNQLINPTIRNYSRSYQPNVGGRTTFTYRTSINNSTFQWITGAEALQQFVTEKTYSNNLGSPGTITNDVEINNTLAFGFSQLTWMRKRWTVTGGISLNSLNVGLKSFMPTYTQQKKQFNNQIAPRLAIMRQFKNNTSLYVTVEKGYTPPSISELAPTGSNINLGLQAAQGWNTSIGCRGYARGDRFFFDINMFMFRLSQSIVQRRDSAGGDYYVNSGGTEQNGAEILLRYAVIRRQSTFFRNLNIAASFSGYRFTYKNFVQVDKDYSGKWLPGVPRHTVAGLADVNTSVGIYLNATYYYSEPIYLNDANTDQVNDYTLLGGRIGYKKTIKRLMLDAYVGGDNLLNKKYSLGNDINAAGGRYYNAAPGINFFAGLSIGFIYKKQPPAIYDTIIETTN